MEAKKTGVEVYLSTIVGGLAIAKLGGMETLGYGITALGGITTLWELVNTFNPYKNLFDSMNLKSREQIPKYKGKRTTDYGYCLTFNLPTGMSTNDFEKKKLAIEQNLNRSIDISYKNHKVFIKVFEIGLKSDQPYKFLETKGIVEFPLGVTYGGKVVTIDLEKVVHILLASETGGGKSTLLRGVITNIILSKKRVALHLIDLKNGAEFNVFRKSKMVKTFSRTIEEAEQVLNSLVNEVEKRYNLFYENDVVDIGEYNRIKGLKRLDYQICIIDEFADLQDEKGSISVVEHLARKARAAGVHLIVATQRPDAKILNGRIKANMPCVIGMKTGNSLNSRIIIDEDGLEKLKGKGHSLLKYGGITEFQSMFLDVKDARELIKHTYIDKKKVAKVKPIGIVQDSSFIESLRGD